MTIGCASWRASRETANAKKTILAAAVTVAAFPAHATVRCAPAPIFETQIMGRYGETVQETQTVRGVQVEVWANPDKGTWTLSARSEGVLCHLADGKNWRGQRINVHFLPAA